jgi:hypothetical protein
MRATLRFARRFVCAALLALGAAARAAEPSGAMVLDPFAQATAGYRGCPETKPPLLTPEQLRIVAHERAERGTYCALEGRCEPGGAYKHDPEVNERVRAAIAADRRFANASLWVTTTRRFVTVSGCVRSAAQKRALGALVRKQEGVDRVFDETRIGTGAPPAH